MHRHPRGLRRNRKFNPCSRMRRSSKLRFSLHNPTRKSRNRRFLTPRSSLGTPLRSRRSKMPHSPLPSGSKRRSRYRLSHRRQLQPRPLSPPYRRLRQRLRLRQGMESANILPNLVATVTKIDGMDYRTITSEPEGEHYFPPVAELASLPQTTVKTQNNLVKMNKRGRMLVTSYEALRFQKLDLFTVVLRQIGAYIARAQAQDAVGVLLNGDGNNNPAEEMNGGSPAALSYDSLVKMWAGLAPFELNTMLAGTETVKSVLNLTEMKDAQAGLNFQGTGQMVTPIGAALIHVPTMADKVIVAMDKTCALEMVQAGELMTDYDKLIDRQLERASISAVTGFAKIFSDASKKLTIS